MAGIWSAGEVTGMPKGEVADLLTFVACLLFAVSSLAAVGAMSDEKTRREVRAAGLRGRRAVLHRAHPRLVVFQLACIAGGAVLALVVVILWLA